MMMSKMCLATLPLSGITVNRYEKERKRSGFVAERLSPEHNPRAAVMSLSPDGVSVLVCDDVQWLHPLHTESAQLIAIDSARALYIGQDTRTHQNVFVANAADASDALIKKGKWTSPRALFGALDAAAPPAENALFSLCLSMYQWVQMTKYCVRCGGAVEVLNGGTSVGCTQCHVHAYPNVSPAIIVAVLDGQGSILLCRRRRIGSAVEGGKVMRTVLSGFVSHGESMEETVMREVEEESKAKVTSVRYVGSQPWPFPHELMCSYYAVAPDSADLVAEEDELFSVAWVGKEEARQALAGEHPDFVFPPAYTAAYFLVKAWVDGDVDDNGAPVK